MAINNNNSTSRSQLQTIINNPYAIRQEIQRFESVHPSIYAVYDLIELIPDIQVATQIREHIVNIEGLYTIKSLSRERKRPNEIINVGRWCSNRSENKTQRGEQYKIINNELMMMHLMHILDEK